MILTSVDALKIFLCSVQSFHKHLLGKRHARTVLEKQGKELDAEEFKSFCQVMKFKDGGHWMWLFVPWKQSLLLFFTHEFQINISLYTDVVLFIFLFFWKTSASARARRACERNVQERAWSARKKNKFFFLHLCPLVLVVNKSPVVYFLSCTPNRLWIENRGSVNRLNQYGQK